METVDLGNAVWRKSRRSGGNGGNCVEVARLSDGQIAMRNSRHPNPSGAVLVFTRDEFAAFVGGVGDGDFDDLT